MMHSDAPQRATSQTAELSKFAAELRYSDLPADVIAKAKLCFRDALACCLSGITQPWTRMVLQQVLEEGGNPRAGVIGTEIRTSIAQAVLVGATAGHGFELDDIHARAHLHAGSLAVPVALALSELRPNITGRDLITAMVAGYEVGLRVGLAATGALFMRGHHFQATCGVFVAAATAANILQLTPDQARNVFGTAGSLAAGLMSAQEGAMVKRLHAGHAAQVASMAALLALKGFTGIQEILETPYGGFLSTLSGQPDLEALTNGLGEVWEIRKVGYKPYATAASVQSPLSALDQIMKTHNLVADDIKAVHVHCSEMAHRHCAWPYRPIGVTSAQMNMLFALSMMAIDRAAMSAQFTEERLEDPKALDFLQRITVEEDPLYSKGGDDTRHAARVKVITVSGQEYTVEMWDRPGSPARPMTEDELRGKFVSLARLVFSEERTDKIDACVMGLEEESFSTLKELLFK